MARRTAVMVGDVAQPQQDARSRRQKEYPWCRSRRFQQSNPSPVATEGLVLAIAGGLAGLFFATSPYRNDLCRSAAIFQTRGISLDSARFSSPPP